MRDKLKNVCIRITDGEHGSISNEPNGEFYLLNNNNITEDGIVINDKDRRISKKDYELIHKRTGLQAGDVVIATCGTLGKTTIITDTDIKYEFSRSVGIIRCNQTKILPEYLNYYFKLDSTQKRIAVLSKGAVQKHFYIGDMEDFEVGYPSIDVQKGIVNALGKIDKKIKCNKKINDNLYQSEMVA